MYVEIVLAYYIFHLRSASYFFLVLILYNIKALKNQMRFSKIHIYICLKTKSTHMPKRGQHTYIVPKFPNLYMECGRTGHHNYTCIHQCRWGECVEKYKECSKLAHKTFQNRVVSNLIFGGYLYCLGDLLNRISHPRRFILSHSSEYLTRSAFYSSDVFCFAFFALHSLFLIFDVTHFHWE